MALYNYMDFGQVASRGEAIKGQRLKNQAASAEIASFQEKQKNRERAKLLRQQFDNTPAQIEALEGEGLFDEADQLRTSYIKQATATVNMLSGLRNGIDGNNYKELRSNLLQAGAIDSSMMPVDYSDNWFKKEIQQKKSNLNKLTRKWSERGVTFAQDLLVRDGVLDWEGKPYTKNLETGSKSGETDKFKMKASDSNAISRYASELYGGMWDPITQRFAGLNKDQAKDVAAVSEAAARIYMANEGRLPHAQAVSRAARQMGIDVRDIIGDRERTGSSNDPNNVRQKLEELRKARELTKPNSPIQGYINRP